jgi:succinate dehydrogenase / fumarate reductase, cytochrome b subunit
MERIDRPLSPHMGVYGWRITNTLSILHRATGLFLSVGALALAYWLLAVASGAEAYEDAQAVFGSGWFKVPLLAWVFCFFFHLANGIRHLFWDVGNGFERGQIRASGWAVVAVATIATIVYALLAFI